MSDTKAGDKYIATNATFSRCERYRYTLTRKWADGPVMLWIMLNPSTADHIDNDPTVERCERRARAAGFGALLVGNIFAFRSTDPGALYQAENPIGTENDAWLRNLCDLADLIVCGWGNHGDLLYRGQSVIEFLTRDGYDIHALRMTKKGHPNHPLYVSYSVKPRPITEILAGKQL